MGTSIGTVQAIFQADTRTFDASVQASSNELNRAKLAAELAGNAISGAGEKIDRTAKLQEAAVDRARAAWQRELLVRERAAAAQAETARGAEIAALKQDILARATQEAAAAAELATKAQARLNAVTAAGRGALSTLGLSPALLGAGAAFAAAEGFKSMIERTMETGVELGKLHQQTGISLEDLSLLKFAAQESGVEFETLTRGFKKLAVTVYDADNGNKKAAQGFAQLGISVSDLRAKGDDMFAVLQMVSAKLNEMPEGIAKSDAAAKIFGARMGSEMIPALDKLARSLDDVKSKAPIFSDADVTRLEKMHQSVTALDAAWGKMALTVTSKVAPALAWYFNEIASGISPAGALRNKIVDLTIAFGQWAGVVKPSTVDLSKHFVPGLPLSLGGAEATTVNKPGGGSGATGAMTINLGELFDQQVEAQTKNADDLKAFYASLDAQARFKWLAQQQEMQPVSAVPGLPDAINSTPMRNQDLGQFAVPQPVSTALQKFRDSLIETAKDATDLGEVLSNTVIASFNSFNETLIRSFSTPRNELRGRHVFRHMGAGIAEDAGGAALRFGEGEITKSLFGLGAKQPLGSSPSTALWVRLVATASPGGVGGGAMALGPASILTSSFGGGGFNVPGIGSLGGGLGGWLAGLGGVAGANTAAASTMALDFAKAGGSALGDLGTTSMDLGAIAGFADGGKIPTNMPVMVGERGPEVLAGAAGRHVIPNHALGGVTHEHNTYIDARGSSDTAATVAALHRAVDSRKAEMQDMALASVSNRNRRYPPGKRI